ncbi:hypothetical protein ROLI_016050 [Roseobacter fucihabitans]|uniref:Uncharacterized protein n=1 Tax=Roseobacter fucihabitans TaxID=1537242 RepID=A0ABZ2BR93_9RHOB|nr:hypothetical protein [Roseobacter litoralis]MBC6966652.1 hypothetical protein [Roseobacter litoralis]
MTLSQKPLLLISVVVFSALLLWWINRSPASLETLIENAASGKLERPVAIDVDFRGRFENWRFICGTVTDPDGTPLVVAPTGLPAPYENNDFCALLDTKDGGALVEFDFGSTDMPAMDWLERYDLDPAILTHASE